MRRWRRMERTGMTSRFVTLFSRYPVSHYITDPQNDMLMWLMSDAQRVDMSIESLARRILLTNFAAIHSTSSASDGIPPLPMVQS